jgi:hypothetical protein
VSIVFVIACTDEGTIERIHEQVPGAPVLAKPVYPQILADAVAAVMLREHRVPQKRPLGRSRRLDLRHGFSPLASFNCSIGM